jgi:hypothetical protein
MKFQLCLFLLLSGVGVISYSTANIVAAVDELQQAEEPDSDVERMMRRRKRKKKSNMAPAPEAQVLFTRSYLTIVGKQFAIDAGVSGSTVTLDIEDNNVLGSIAFATGGSAETFGGGGKFVSVLGSSFLQSGPIYNPDDVKFVDCSRNKQNSACFNGINEFALNANLSARFEDRLDDLQRGIGSDGLQFGGGKQPNVEDLRPPKNNFFFAGECTATSGFGLSQVLAHSCLYNLCLGGVGNDCVNIFAGGGFIFDPFAKVLPNEEPLVPPSFPGAVIGGTGKYQGIKGNAQIVTITTRTGSNVANSIGLSLIQDPASPLANFETPSVAGVLQTGYITQLIQLETTQALPPSKTQESD